MESFNYFWCILFFIIGIFISFMFHSQTYHAPDSNIVRQTIFEKDGKKCKLFPVFIPIIKS